jgi:hypothetical protein
MIASLWVRAPPEDGLPSGAHSPRFECISLKLALLDPARDSGAQWPHESKTVADSLPGTKAYPYTTDLYARYIFVDNRLVLMSLEDKPMTGSGPRWLA